MQKEFEELLNTYIDHFHLQLAQLQNNQVKRAYYNGALDVLEMLKDDIEYREDFDVISKD